MNAKKTTKTSLDGISKQKAIDAEMEWAKVELLLETLETRKSDGLDFHEIPVWSIRDLVRHAFEAGYHEACTRVTAKGERTRAARRHEKRPRQAREILNCRRPEAREMRASLFNRPPIRIGAEA